MKLIISYGPSKALYSGSVENVLLMTSTYELQILDSLLLIVMLVKTVEVTMC